MESTCDFKTCKVASKLRFKNPGQCFNNVQSFWLNPDTGIKQDVNDCAPKRTLLMVMDLSNRLTGVQKSQEQQRNVLKPLEELAQITMEERKLLKS